MKDCRVYNCLKQEDQEEYKPLIDGVREEDYDSTRNDAHGTLPEDKINFHNAHSEIGRELYKNDNAHKVLPDNEIHYHDAHSAVDRDLNREYENPLALAHQDPSRDVGCGAHEDSSDVRKGAHCEQIQR